MRDKPRRPAARARENHDPIPPAHSARAGHGPSGYCAPINPIHAASPGSVPRGAPGESIGQLAACPTSLTSTGAHCSGPVERKDTRREPADQKVAGDRHPAVKSADGSVSGASGRLACPYCHDGDRRHIPAEEDQHIAAGGVILRDGITAHRPDREKRQKAESSARRAAYPLQHVDFKPASTGVPTLVGHVLPPLTPILYTRATLIASLTGILRHVQEDRIQLTAPPFILSF